MADAITDVEGLLGGRVGLRLDPSLRARLSRCVAEEAGASSLTLADYAIKVATDQALFQQLLNRVTVQQTAFFRDAAVFEAIASEVLPAMTDPVLTWSAGCANGQETYSLAMLLEESQLRDWLVLGTDISTKALRRAENALYSEAEVSGLGEGRRAVHMDRSGPSWQVRPRLRDRVSFRYHNLLSDPSPFPAGQFQIILCRNVLIYFSARQLSSVLDRLASWLHPEGYLFLGASESLWKLSDRFRLVRVGRAFAYRLGGVSLERRRGERRRSERLATADRRQTPTVNQLLAAGEAAASGGDFTAAAESFRRATFVDPEHPLPYFELALCLERAGRRDAALQAMRDARAAIDRCDTSRLEAALEGYRPEEFVRAIDLHLRTAPC